MAVYQPDLSKEYDECECCGAENATVVTRLNMGASYGIRPQLARLCDRCAKTTYEPPSYDWGCDGS